MEHVFSPMLIWDAYCFAFSKHDGQVDKAGKPYILHPVFVASSLTETEEMICALLHDTMEDTSATYSEIEGKFGSEIAKHVAVLTRGIQEDYFTYIKRVREDKVATKVKRADLAHNMDIRRIPCPGKRDYERIEKYRRAMEMLK